MRFKIIFLLYFDKPKMRQESLPLFSKVTILSNVSKPAQQYSY